MSHDDTEAGDGFFSKPTAVWAVASPAVVSWPAGASGAQGTIAPIESGYNRRRLQRVDATWKIVHHEIVLHQPMAFRGA
jgi:hypothetical protein